MNAKISVLAICVEALIYLLYNLNDCASKASVHLAKRNAYITTALEN